MTIEAVGHDSPLPIALPVNYFLSHPEYGFSTETWKENPVAKGPDWFSAEERSRRNSGLGLLHLDSSLIQIVSTLINSGNGLQGIH
jgi:hypothetical protein